MYESLEELNEVVKKCNRCKLCNKRKNTVFGVRRSK